MIQIRSYILVLALLGASTFFRFNEQAAEWYAAHIYPIIATVLVTLSKWVPFAVSDLLYLTIIAGALYFLFGLLFRQERRIGSLRGLTLLCLWFYTLLQLLWGINYGRPDFFTRNKIEKSRFDSVQFTLFCENYVDQMNEAYLATEKNNRYVGFQEEADARYSELTHEMKLYPPYLLPTVKSMLFGRLFAGMGVQGYFGFIVCEPLINPYVYQWGYSFSFAHEMAHAMGIAGEGEANFMAWLVCTRSSDASTRFSGYFSVLNYLISDAGRVVSPQYAKQLVERIDPHIRLLKRDELRHYDSLYWEQAGKVQDKVYHSFLQAQGLRDGVANYSQVISFIVSYTNAVNSEKHD